MSRTIFPGKRARKCATKPHTALSSIVFLWLDFVKTLLCVIYRYLNRFFEGQGSPCCCIKKGEAGRNCVTKGDEEEELSETLHERKNIFREMEFLGFLRKWKESERMCSDGVVKNRWSDCACEYYGCWMKRGKQKVHVEVREASEAVTGVSRRKANENVIFLHEFRSSSSFGTETVFPNIKTNSYRLVAVDLLGFGRIAKPRDKLYTLRDQLEMTENAVIFPFELKSFHLFGHSMGWPWLETTPSLSDRSPSSHL